MTVLRLVLGKIEFCEVRFVYTSKPNLVFNNLSFTVNAGTTIAVVGPSGSGKSTIISLMQRFYDPTSGDKYFKEKFYLQFIILPPD